MIGIVICITQIIAFVAGRMAGKRISFDEGYDRGFFDAVEQFKIAYESQMGKLMEELEEKSKSVSTNN